MHTGPTVSDVAVFLVGLAVILLLLRGVVGFFRGFFDGLRHTSPAENRQQPSRPSSLPNTPQRVLSVDGGISTSTNEPTRPSIFISYRRNDSSDVTGRIYDRLVQHFGRRYVFKDVDSVPLGVDFRRHLHDSVHQCQVLLAIIGKKWPGEETAPPRITDERDYVRIEINAALERDIPVIPVLVQDAQMPSETYLPDTLKPLLFRNGVSVRSDPAFHQDVDRLIRGIEGHVNHLVSTRRENHENDRASR